jgi:uncharacterized membrane protein YeaQ/YmgE (transglycosylase-associated protein family)
MDADLVIPILFSGLITGGLARLAVPGPDPMPLWLTIAIGLAGSIAGAVAARALFNDSTFVVSVGGLAVAIALVVAYRRFVQHRPVWGPGALRFPHRGLGIEKYRSRLQRLGIDPDRGPLLGKPPGVPAAPAAPDPDDHLLAMLSELHREGVLDDEEFAAKRALVEERGSDPAGSTSACSSTASGSTPRGKTRSAVRPQLSARQM